MVLTRLNKVLQRFTLHQVGGDARLVFASQQLHNSATLLHDLQLETCQIHLKHTQ